MRIEAARYLRSLILLGGLLLFPAAASLLAHSFGLTAVVGAWVSGPRLAPPPPPPSSSDNSTPPPGWREHAYLAANPDVAAAVRSGAIRSGYEHYHLIGEREGRRGGLPASPAAAPAGTPPVPAPAPVPAPVATPAAAPPAAASAVPTLVPSPAPAPAAGPLPPPTPAVAAVALVPPPPVKPHPPAAEPPPALPEAAPAPLVAPPPPTPPAPTATMRETGARETGARETGARETGAVVQAVRFGRHPGFVRMVLESSARLPEQPRLAPDGRGLTMALDGVGWTAPRSWKGGTAALLTGYEVEEMGAAGRFVLHAARPLALRHVMRLPPEGNAGHRLVIDLEPADGMP